MDDFISRPVNPISLFHMIAKWWPKKAKKMNH
jgi:hypothetical protein